MDLLIARLLRKELRKKSVSKELMKEKVKKYKRAVILPTVVLFSGLIFVLAMNLDEGGRESITHAAIVGVIGISTILILSGKYSYLQRQGSNLTQRDWAVFWKNVDVKDITYVKSDPKYKWAFGYIEYFLIYTASDQKPVITINPNSHKPKVLAELLNDLEKINPNIHFDERVSKKMTKLNE